MSSEMWWLVGYLVVLCGVWFGAWLESQSPVDVTMESREKGRADR